MSFLEVADTLLEEYRELWTRLAHHDTGCKGEFQHIDGGWHVCPKCGTAYEEYGMLAERLKALPC